MPTNLLISLYKGYGLGDAVQMSAVLRHVVAARPNLRIDYQAEEGKHQVGRGIVANTFAYGEPYPSAHYDAEAQIILYDTWANWGDRPNTRVSSCLHERFGLPWKPELGRYQVQVSQQAMDETAPLVSPNHVWKSHKSRNNKQRKDGPVVALHYQGDSSPNKKNLTHDQAARVCRVIEQMGFTVMLVDWRNQSPLPDAIHVRTTGKALMARQWGGNAEMNCAVISHCSAFIGIDSGPSKCASATDTPALVIWTGHHPAPFHDPAPNTTHLCPRGYHGLEPVCNDRGVIRWFEANHSVREYDRDPVGEAEEWLRDVLR